MMPKFIKNPYKIRPRAAGTRKACWRSEGSALILDAPYLALYPFAIFLFFCWRIPSWIPPYPPYPSIFLHFHLLFSSIFRPFFDLFFGSIFGRIFGRFLDDFGVDFGHIFRYGCILFRAFILLPFYSNRFRKYVNYRTPESRKIIVFPN